MSQGNLVAFELDILDEYLDYNFVCLRFWVILCEVRSWSSWSL